MNILYAVAIVLVFMVISYKWLCAEVRMRRASWYYVKAMHIFREANKRKRIYRRCMEELILELNTLKEMEELLLEKQQYILDTSNCTEGTALVYEYTNRNSTN